LAVLLAACANPLPAPDVARVAFDPADAPARGRADAPVQIVEFADFRCPYCARFQPILKRLLAEYPDDVRLAFVHMPVVAQDSGRAAVAAEAARQQGDFWGMHDALFARSAAPLDEAELRAVALTLGLDAERFSADLRDPALLTRVRADLVRVERLGLDATPALLVNGRLFVGLQTYPRLRRVVDEELAAAQ